MFGGARVPEGRRLERDGDLLVHQDRVGGLLPYHGVVLLHVEHHRCVFSCDLLAKQYNLSAAPRGAGAVAGAHDEQVAHGLLVVDDLGDGRRQRAAAAARGVRQEHLEAQPDCVQVDALWTVYVREAGSKRVYTQSLSNTQGFSYVASLHALNAEVLELVLVGLFRDAVGGRADTPVASLATHQVVGVRPVRFIFGDAGYYDDNLSDVVVYFDGRVCLVL